MILPVSRLSESGMTLEGEEPPEVFEWTDSPREVIHPVSPLGYRLTARRFGNELLVTGRVQARFQGICCRCGGPLDRVYEGEVAYSQTLSAEITEVDLTSELREVILLALPNNPVCSDTCPGLCPHCGKRLADGPCNCAASVTEGPWSALDSLL